MHVSLSDVVRELSTLPSGRIAEVHDFVLFLKNRDSQSVDERDEWSDEDVRDASAASRNYAAGTLLAEDASDDSAG